MRFFKLKKINVTLTVTSETVPELVPENVDTVEIWYLNIRRGSWLRYYIDFVGP